MESICRRATVRQGAQHGQGVDPNLHVMASLFPEFLVGRDDVEHVIDDLKEHSERVAILGESIDYRSVKASNNSTYSS